jgi:hypothetical protein
MRRSLFIFCLLLSSIHQGAFSQNIDGAYVKALYQKYPTLKSDLCSSCKLWVNPYFRSIADTAAHRPLLTYYVYTKAHRLEQEALNLPRTGIYAAWHSAYGQPDETKSYRYANKQIGKTNSAEMIARAIARPGYCCPGQQMVLYCRILIRLMPPWNTRARTLGQNWRQKSFAENLRAIKDRPLRTV